MKGLVPKTVFMLDTLEPNLALHTESCEGQVRTPQYRSLDDKLHIEGITDGYVESLESIQVSFRGHSITTDVVPDDFRIPQEGISGTDF